MSGGFCISTYFVNVPLTFSRVFPINRSFFFASVLKITSFVKKHSLVTYCTHSLILLNSINRSSRTKVSRLMYTEGYTTDLLASYPCTLLFAE
jgi:hypothetical protein